MKIFLLFSVFGAVCVTVCSSAERRFSAVSRVDLGDEAHVFEIVRGEVAPNLPFLKRVEVGNDSVVFFARNESAKSIELKIEAEFFNNYGMRICRFEGIFESGELQPGGVGVKQFELSFPQLEGIFKESTIQLPADWRKLRFVRLNVTQRDSSVSLPSSVNLRRPRPQSVQQQQSRPAILSENRFGPKNLSLTGIDAKWSNYGAYLQRVIDTVQIQWERLILQMSVMPVSGSSVTVRFSMNDEGRITNITRVGTSTDNSSSRACISAITDRSPYGPWTEDMRATLGRQQEMTFTFYYQ